MGPRDARGRDRRARGPAGRVPREGRARSADDPDRDGPDRAAPLTGGPARFFHDPAVWEGVEGVAIPTIFFEKGRGAMIRAWVPACGTGETAYALAMALWEHAEAAGRVGDLRIFATDVDRAAIAAGRQGVYPASIAADLAPGRLRRFFTREAGGFRIGLDLRRKMFFAAHDVIRDPPYPQLDLIFGAHLRGVPEGARKPIAGSLRRALRPGGLLVQGAAPLIDVPSEWFQALADHPTILRRTAWPYQGAPDVGFAAVFMDRRLRVAWVTPVMTRYFGLGLKDRDRPIEDIAARIDDPDLPDDARAVLDGGEPVSRQVRDPTGRWFIRRVQPARSAGDPAKGVVAVFTDVTPLKQAEGEARAAQAYFQSIVDTVPQPLIVLDAGLKVRSANGSYYRTFRACPQDVVGRPVHELGRGEWDEPRLRAGLERALADGVPFDDIEIDTDYENLGRRTMRLGARRVEGLPFVLLAIEDVTERRRTAAALEESRRRLQALFENTQDAILLADDRGLYVDANPAACELTGYRREELLERTILDLTPEDHRPAGRDLWRAFLTRGRMEGEYSLTRKDGRAVEVEFRAVAHVLPGLHLSILRDVGERRRLEKEVLEIASAEQRRIGQELHDDAGQVLTGLGLMARVLADRLEQDSPGRKIAARIVDGIGEVLDRIRAVAKGLIPVEVDADGLMAALADLAFQTDELDGLSCRFDCDEPVTVRDNTTATQLYRIAQEAVTNAVRHARPAHIRIALGRREGRIHLEVTDDGRGLPEPLDERASRGLRIMRYRAGLIGASLSIGRAGEMGTSVLCIFDEENRHVERDDPRA